LLSTIVLVSTSGLREQAEIAKTLTWVKSIDSLLGADAVGIWNMDENPATQGTTIKDMSGWGNDGTLNTGETGVNKSVAGVVGNAISFDGVNDYVDCGIGASLNIAEAITIEAWVKPNAITGVHRMVNKKSAYEFLLLNTDEVQIELNDTTAIITTASPISNIGAWYHLVFTYDRSLSSNRNKLFVNGVLFEQTDLFTSSINTNSNIVSIGYEPTRQYFNGHIDEVRIYNRALTTAQIESHYYVGLNKLLAKKQITEQEYQQKLAKN